MLQTKPQPQVVWKPIPNSSQELALDTRAQITLFTGSRGPGKTDTQLMRFRKRVGMGYGPFWRGVIFDREYKNLDDVVSKSKRWFNAFRDGAKFLESAAVYKWIWPTGEELLFRVLKKPDDYNDYHGQEFPYIGWNELTKYPTPELFDKMMSCNRSSWTWEKDAPIDPKTGNRADVPPIPLEVFATTNSSGPGHNWVKVRLIDPAPYGTIVRRSIRVFNPQTQKEEEVQRTQVAIFGSYKENIYLDPQYVANLAELKDPNLRKSWLEGSWDVVAGGAFDDIWNKSIHVLRRFPVPITWKVDRTFDWGSTKPFSVGWWAEANGEEVKLPWCETCNFPEKHQLHTDSKHIQFHKFIAKVWAPAAGSLIQIAELYGTKELGMNEGLKWSAKKIAWKIKEIEDELIAYGFVQRKPYPGPADNQIRDVREEDVETIEKKMSDEGVRWQRSDKSPGSRKNGLELARGLLENATSGDGPGLYFMENCVASIATIPVLPRDEDYLDDVDSDAEDHCWDMARYRVLKGKGRYAKQIKVTFAS